MLLRSFSDHAEHDHLVRTNICTSANVVQLSLTALTSADDLFSSFIVDSRQQTPEAQLDLVVVN